MLRANRSNAGAYNGWIGFRIDRTNVHLLGQISARLQDVGFSCYQETTFYETAAPTCADISEKRNASSSSNNPVNILKFGSDEGEFGWNLGGATAGSVSVVNCGTDEEVIGDPDNPPPPIPESSGECNCGPELAALQTQINTLVSQLNSLNAGDLSAYLKKSELVNQISSQKNQIVLAIVPASSWPTIDVTNSIKKALGI